MATQQETSDIKKLQEDVFSLKLDNDKVIKPAIQDIKAKLDRDIYVPRASFEKFESDTDDRLKSLESVTRNTPLVERAVLSVIGFILITVVGAVVGYVIVTRPGV